MTKDKLWNFKISFSKILSESPSSAAGQALFPSQSCQGQPIPSLTVVLDHKRNNRMANAQYDRGNQTLFHPEDPPMANLRRVAFVMMSFVDNYTSPLARNPHDTTIGFSSWFNNGGSRLRAGALRLRMAQDVSSLEMSSRPLTHQGATFTGHERTTVLHALCNKDDDVRAGEPLRGRLGHLIVNVEFFRRSQLDEE